MMKNYEPGKNRHRKGFNFGRYTFSPAYKAERQSQATTEEVNRELNLQQICLWYSRARCTAPALLFEIQEEFITKPCSIRARSFVVKEVYCSLLSCYSGMKVRWKSMTKAKSILGLGYQMFKGSVVTYFTQYGRVKRVQEGRETSRSENSQGHGGHGDS